MHSPATTVATLARTVMSMAVAIGVHPTAMGEDYVFSDQAAEGIPARPGHWTLRRGVFENHTAQPARLACVTQLERAPRDQYGREITVPPRTRCRVTYPVRIPTDVAARESQLALETQLIHRQPGGELVLPNASGQALRRGVAIAEHESPVTALIVAEDDPESRSLIEAARSLRGLSTRIYRLGTLPSAAWQLAAFDQVVIADASLLDDPQGTIAIRQWLHGGGRVWILLDKVAEQVLETLLGDAYDGVVLDRMTLARFQLADTRPIEIKRHGAVRTDPRPVAFTLAEAGTAAVEFAIDGAPAAWWYSAGRGAVLVTALGPRGWLPESSTPAQQSTTPLAVLAERLFTTRPPDQLPPGVLRKVASETIGYRVPSRWLVISLLAGLCLVILLAAIVLSRWAMASWIAVVAPTAAVLVTAVFLAIGVRSRQQLPATLARSQLVRVQPQTGDYVVEGGVGLFEPAATTEPLAGEGPPLEWEAAASDSATRRLIWVGLDRWQTGRARLPAGLSVGSDATSGTLQTDSGAEATFDAEGLRGQLELPVTAHSGDALVLSGAGPALAIAVQPDGSFAARADQGPVVGPLYHWRAGERSRPSPGWDDPRVRDARAGPCHPCGSPVAGVDRSVGLRSRVGR